MPLRFESRCSSPVPLDWPVTPELLAGQSISDIERLRLWHGNRQEPAAEFFRISGASDGDELSFEGDLTHVQHLGQGMRAGRIRVVGSVGRHLGAQMRGGAIDVEGSAGDWLGAEMRDGTIHVRGSAGSRVGAAYHGDSRGMTGGEIVVDGDAGHELAHSMRRGLIAVGGAVGQFAGINMIAGTLIVGGQCGAHLGAGMRRGTLLLLGAKDVELLPTFRDGGDCRPLFVELYLRRLAAGGWSGVKRPGAPLFRVHHGDMLHGGRGEILIRSHAPA